MRGRARNRPQPVCDGKQCQNRKKIADHAREPFWAPDSTTIGYLPQEYPKFNVIDYYTKGMRFYNLISGQTEPHPNTANLKHLDNPCFASNGKWMRGERPCAAWAWTTEFCSLRRAAKKIINLEIPWLPPVA